MNEIQPIQSPQLIVHEKTRHIVESTNIEGEKKVVEKTYITLDYYDKYGNIKTLQGTNVIDYLI
jgi:hypothetical protein